MEDLRLADMYTVVPLLAISAPQTSAFPELCRKKVLLGEEIEDHIDIMDIEIFDNRGPGDPGGCRVIIGSGAGPHLFPI